MFVLSGSSHPQLAAALAKSLSAPLVRRTISRFSDQTYKIRLNSDVKDKTVIIVQSLVHPVHDHLIELLLLADACKSAYSKKIIAAIPYLAYSKQDQIFLSGGDSNLFGLPEYLQKELDIPVSLANPWVNAKFPSKYLPSIKFKDSLRFSSVIGLSLKVMESEKIL